jgi:tetratricopeptide (TPR) repeat protein
MTSNGVSASNKIWLIKSSNRILGPYNLDEVIALLVSNQVTALDEIRQSEGRWEYIRESKYFLDVLKNVRSLQDKNSDKTMTASSTQQTSTKTDGGPANFDDKIPTPVTSAKSYRVDLSFPENFKDVIPRFEKNINSNSSMNDGLIKKSYGAENDHQLHGRIRKQTSTLTWFVSAVALGLVLSAILMVNRKDRLKAIGYEDLLNQAIRYKNLGLYQKAVQSYNKAAQMKQPDAEIQVQMAPVLISESNESLQSRRILEKALTVEGRSRNDLIQAYLGIAVSHLIDGNLIEANATLQKAVGYEPTNESALLNLAIVQLKNGQDQKAQEEFLAIYKKNPKANLALYGYSLATIERAKFTKTNDQLNGLISDLKLNLKAKGELSHQLSFLLVFVENLNGDSDAVNRAITDFLATEVGVSDRVAHPLFVHWRFSQWDYLEKYCSELYEKSVQTAEMKALRAVCLLEVNRDSEAEKMIQQALSESPKDPYILGVQAGFLKKAGRIPEAMTILKTPEISSLSLKDHLLIQICMSTMNVVCVEKTANLLYQKDMTDFVALEGLAWVQKKNKNTGAALEYLRTGLEIEPHQIPLLEMRETLESQ